MQGRSYTGPIVIAAAVVLIAIVVGGIYNSLVSSSQAVDAQWGQVQTAYQRRSDLIPNLVATVQGSANFEKSTYVAVTQARAQVGQISPQALQGALNDPQAFQKFAAMQDQLGGALSKLLVTVENYPQLKSTENFATLQAQIEGAENRVSFERKKYNDAARDFNTRRDSIPAVLFAGMFGSRFNERPYFAAAAGTDKAPVVTFSP
jgi:LemA protein